jgi:putative membrane protein
MRRSILCLALALSAGTVVPMVTSTQVWAAPVDAATYVQKAAIGDLFEIESSKLAKAQATSPQIKSFAEMMVTDHTQSSQKIAAAAPGMPAPTQLDPQHQEQLAQLQKATGSEFDRTYLDMQVKAHTDALQLHQDYAANGGDPKLKAVAAEIVPVVSHHLEEAKRLAGAAQTTATPAEPANATVTAKGVVVASSADLKKGANSFTEAQAKSRIEDLGFTNVAALKKDDDGIWWATASKDSKSVKIGLDFQGNVSAE